MIPSTGVLTVSELRAEAIESNSRFYAGLFTNDPAMADLRNAYSIPENSIKDPMQGTATECVSSSGYHGHVSRNDRGRQ